MRGSLPEIGSGQCVGSMPSVVESLEPRVFMNASLPARQAEFLDRGTVALAKTTTSIYVSWRLLASDDPSVSFNVYRSVNNGAFSKLNTTAITATTDWTDTVGVNLANSYSYYVRPVVGGNELPAGKTFTIPANTAVSPRLSIPLQVPAGGTTPTGEVYTYSANDTSVGDVDGDGQYEFIVKWDPSNSKDNSQSGYTGNVYIDAYRMDGTRLWRIDLGRNIRAGAHYTQFLVYDFDGDGKAELVCKTGDGTVDGVGTVIGNGAADYRSTAGYVLTGPEYLTVFNGLTGAAMATTSYVVPRGSVSSWGDSYGNRVDRFLATTAYLDGVRPSIVMCRGYYTRAVLAAFDWRNGVLTQRWVFDSDTAVNGAAYRGQGAHSISVADVDGDGKDEIMYGAAMIDDNGVGLYSTALGHGDATHLSDMDPTRPGLEIFMAHETESSYTKNGIRYGGDLRDARTGELLRNVDGGGDVGRGVAFDVDPRYLGYEMWTSANANMYNVDGTVTSTARPANYNFGVWWDADPLRELLSGTAVDKWNWTTNSLNRVLTIYQSGAASNNGTKATPNLSGDLMGDWREEMLFRNADSTALLLYTTTIAATSRLVTLMHDIQYRQAIAWQNVGYNQPPHPSFYLGDGMTTPPAANLFYAGVSEAGVYPAETSAFSGGVVTEATNTGYRGTAYLNFSTTGGVATFSGVAGGVGGAGSMTIRYALGAATSRTGTLVVNGVSQAITFPTTGAWTTWATMTVPVTLAAGSANVIAFQSTGQDLANIDQITVLPTTHGTITGFTYQDNNSNGAADTGEARVTGQMVYLDGNNNGILDTGERWTLSLGTGTATYTFGSVVPGTYVVRAVAGAGYHTLGSASVAVASGGVGTASLPLTPTRIVATGGNDVYRLARNGAGQYEIYVGAGAGVLTYVLAGTIPSLTVDLSGGNDTLTLDYTLGMPMPGAAVSVNGGAGTNTLAVLGVAGASLVTVTGGNVTLVGTGAATAGLAVSVSAGATAGFSGSMVVGAVSVNDGRAVVVAGSGSTVVMGALTVGELGALDLTDNAVVVNYAGASPVAYLRELVGAGRDGGGWSGVGITSSSAAADAELIHSVGYAEASELLALSGEATDVWEGQVVDATALLLKYTYTGDTDLSGALDGTDVGNVVEALSVGGSGWTGGDSNFDGVVNSADYQLLMTAYALSSSPRPGARGASGSGSPGRGAVAFGGVAVFDAGAFDGEGGQVAGATRSLLNTRAGGLVFSERRVNAGGIFA